MKLTHVLAASAVLLATSQARAEDVLHIYNWTDYTSTDMLKKFTDETGIKVTLDTFDTNETMLAKLRSGSSGYDITVASTDFIPILVKQGLIQPVNISELPGYENLDARWKNAPWDPGNKYSIPWQWGVTSAIVDTSVYKGPTDSLKVLFEPPPELRGKVGMFAAPSEVISLALRYLGKPPCNDNTADLKEVDQLLEKQKPSIKLYNSDGNLDREVSGETVVAQIANGEGMRARFQKPSLHFIFGKEGGVAWVDNIVVPKTASRPDLARKFISFMMDPKNAAMESVAGGYPTGIGAAKEFLPPDMRDAPELTMPADYKTVVTPTCPEEVTRKYDRIWTKLRQ